MGGQSEQICEIIIHTKNLFKRILELSSQATDFSVRTEALVCLYNICENHNSKYLPLVISYHPESVFIDVLQNYQNHDPYTLKISISFLSLICEKFGEQAVQSIVQTGVAEMIENVIYKFSENQELCAMVNSLLETYIYKVKMDEDTIELNTAAAIEKPATMSFNI